MLDAVGLVEGTRVEARVDQFAQVRPMLLDTLVEAAGRP